MAVSTTRFDKKIDKLKQKQLELDQMIADLEEARKASSLEAENPKIKELFKQVEEVAASFKVPAKKIIQLLGNYAKTTEDPKATVVKYRDTASGCGNNTWSGRGLPPLWIKRYEAAGHNRQNFLVKS